jgi:hypothetical protein
MSGITGAAAKVGRTHRGLLPSGQLLTPEVWARRHRGIVWLLWLRVAGIASCPTCGFQLATGRTQGRVERRAAGGSARSAETTTPHDHRP